MLIRSISISTTHSRIVKKIVSDLAVMDVTEDGFVLLERAPGVSVEEIKSKTAGKLIVPGDVPEISFN